MAFFTHFLLLLLSLFAAYPQVLGDGGRALHFVNKCDETIWVGTLGSSVLNGGGWAVAPGQTVTVSAPPGWHGRFWGRTGCSFDGSGKGKCETGDCGGLAKCGGIGGLPPATLAEFSLGPPMDFYDVSLVDGYNLRVSVTPLGGRGSTASTTHAGHVDAPAAGVGTRIGDVSALTISAGASMPNLLNRRVACHPAGCDTDVNAFCPAVLRVGGSRNSVVACRSACNAFSKPQFCCTGAYSQPSTCRPSSFSRLFKRACPHAYTFAFDDPTSIFTCTAPNSYLISFCS